jgi:hypothetical protein
VGCSTLATPDRRNGRVVRPLVSTVLKWNYHDR